MASRHRFHSSPGSTAVATALSLAACALVAAPASATLRTPVKADTLNQSAGVNIHTPYTGTAYTQQSAQGTDLVLDRLKDLGIRHVRDNYEPMNAATASLLTSRYQAFAAAGIGVTALTGSPGGGPVSNYVNTLANSPYLAAVEALEGTNEWNIFGGWNWAAEAAQRQKDLLGAVANAGLSIPVHSPSLGNPADPSGAPTPENKLKQAAANINTPLTSANGQISGHFYPGADKPLSAWGGVNLSAIQSLSPGRKIQLTESGYHTYPDPTLAHKPVSERAAAIYLTRMLLEYGQIPQIDRTYLYELFDEPESRFAPSQAYEGHFGLVRSDGVTGKPSYAALRSLLRLTEDHGQWTQAPQALDYSVAAVGQTDSTDNIEHSLFQKSNGQYVLFVWRDAQVWDPATNQDVEPDGSVTLTLPGEPHIRIHDVVRRCTPIVSGTLHGPFTWSVGDQIFAFTFGGNGSSDVERPC